MILLSLLSLGLLGLAGLIIGTFSLVSLRKEED
jgi:hypothetical protein